MADEFFLDEESFDAVMNDLSATGKSFGANYSALSAVLTQYDGAWGGDDMGKAFEKGYFETGQADLLIEGLEVGGKNLTESADNGIQGARNLASFDEEDAKWIDAHTTVKKSD